MALHPALKRLIRKAYAAGHGELPKMNTQEVREHCALLVPPSNTQFTFEDHHPKSSIRFRIHRTQSQSKGTVLYLRGSAFTGGGLLDETNGYCDYLARFLNKDIVNCGFRVAPDFKFPTYFEDCVATVEWIIQQSASLELQAPFVLWGESSGGTKAASLTQYFTAQGLVPYDQVVLAYPMMNLCHHTPSKEAYGNGFLLDLNMIEWLKDKTLNHPDEARDYRASPGMNATLGHCPTLILTAQYDPLRDEGEDYAHRLQQAKIACDYRCQPSMVHGFLRYHDRLTPAQEALNWIKERLVEK